MANFIMNDPSMRLHVVVEGVDITKDITSYKKSGEYMTDGVFCLGNAPSVSVNLTLINKGGKYNGYMDKEFYIYEKTKNGKIDVGYFYVFERPEKFTEVIELELNDGMRGLGVPYDSKLTYPAQLISQLNEISQITGYPIAPLPPDFLSFSPIGFYDNTITIRQHLAWIAEMNGCNVWINRKKQIEFKPVDKNRVDYTLPLEMLGDLEDEQVLYKVSEVFYDNGLNLYTKGDKTAFSLQLSPDNLYILDQSVVDNIYNKVGNLTLHSLSNIKVKGNPKVDLGDIISLTNNKGVKVYKFMVLKIEETQNLNAVMQKLDGKIDTKEAQRTVDIINNNQKIKKIQTIVNQQEGKLSIIAEEINGIDDKIKAQVNIEGDRIVQEIDGKFLSTEEHEAYAKDVSAKFELYVDKKNIISYINASADVITLNSNRLEINSDKFKLAADGTLEAVNGKFSGDIFGSTITFGDLLSKYVVMKPHVVETKDPTTGEVTKREITGADIEGNGGIHIKQQGDNIELVSLDSNETKINRLNLDAKNTQIFLTNFNTYGDSANTMFLQHRKNYKTYTDEQGQKVWYSKNESALDNYNILDNTLANAIRLSANNNKDYENKMWFYNQNSSLGKTANQLMFKGRTTENSFELRNFSYDSATSGRYANSILGWSRMGDTLLRLYNTPSEKTLGSYSNSFYMWNVTSGTPFNRIALDNYSPTLNHLTNSMVFDSQENHSKIDINNFHRSAGSSSNMINNIQLINSLSHNTISLRNRNDNFEFTNIFDMTYDNMDGRNASVVDIGNYNGTGQQLANRFTLSSDNQSALGGISLNNWRDAYVLQSQFRMDRAGNINMQCQNSVSIESENYNIYLRADMDSSHNNVGSGSVIIQAPRGLWVNGKKIA